MHKLFLDLLSGRSLVEGTSPKRRPRTSSCLEPLMAVGGIIRVKGFVEAGAQSYILADVKIEKRLGE